jgi:hypothetical protein
MLWCITQIDANLIPEYANLFHEDLIYLPMPNLLHLEVVLNPWLWIIQPS